ncbi:MAG: malto-oligosyltrehalose synthase [Planctomycetaceae bacterium]|nr:malto-oligosyltrehalose synthase [Planctomycetaceae bacterium]
MMHIPGSTYRIQFTPEFGFKQACQIVPYLAALGISDLYASPIFKAVSGSLHGYDVTDPNRLNPQLGTKDEFVLLALMVKEHHMAWMQDIVPNHMAFHCENAILMDVLEKGDQSEFAGSFDMRVHNEEDERRRPVTIPVLAEPFENALAEHKIKLAYKEKRLWVTYFELAYPLCWDSYPDVFETDGAEKADLKDLLEAIQNVEEPAACKEETLESIRTMFTEDPALRASLKKRLDFLNGENELPDKAAPLRGILNKQYFRLIYWRDFNAEGNYRRFFYLTDFIGLNTGRRDVFERTHRLIYDYVQKGFFQGLRIDHIDGLYQPLRYLKRLRDSSDDVYIVVEKILNMEEKLPAEWPIQGTTGYDFMNFVNGLFCDSRAESIMTELYEAFTGQRQDWNELLADSKRNALDQFLECDLTYLAGLAMQTQEQHTHSKTPTIETIRAVLKELIVQLDVYRTYIDDEISVEDDRRLETAIQRAMEHSPGLRRELKMLKQLLLSKQTRTASEGEAEDFVLRFQQYTGPVMAKGLEDTCFYRYNRLISLNEVGGRPTRFGVAPHEFDAFISERAWTFGLSMNASSTHDTKRGEDARARINVLSEMPDLWRQATEYWAALNEDFRRKIGAEYAPSRNDEYFIYQTMIGSFPFEESQEADFFERLKATAVKAAREAKIHTNWTDPNAEYERAIKDFIDCLAQPDGQFLTDFRRLHRQTAFYGIFNSLSQTLIKMTAPGVPDFYQGSELWNLSMVDPDNRRGVDYAQRARMLAEITAKTGRDTTALLRELMATPQDGRIKMYTIWKTLHLRAGFRELFERGDYVPLQVRGSLRDHLIAFARVHGERAAVTAVPRFLSRFITPDTMPLGEIWNDTEVMLPEEFLAAWYNCFTEARTDAERSIKASDLLAGFPVACVVNVPEYHLKLED